jgi:hypothetical protein
LGDYVEYDLVGYGAVIWWKFTDTSEKYGASIFRIKESVEHARSKQLHVRSVYF